MRKENKKRASCHPEKPHASRGLCSSCYCAWLKTNNPSFAERQKQNVKKWLSEHSEYAKEYKKQEIIRKGGPVFQRRLDLKKHYNITPEQYEEMFLSQNGRCAICGKTQEENKRYLSIDHCHDTKEIRGLLCLACNCGLGYFKDSVDRLKSAMNYLQKKD